MIKLKGIRSKEQGGRNKERRWIAFRIPSPLFLLPCSLILFVASTSALTVRFDRPRLLTDPSLIAQWRAKKLTSQGASQWNSVVTYGTNYFSSRSLSVARALAFIHVVDPAVRINGLDPGVRACEIMNYHVDPNDSDPGGVMDSPSDWQNPNNIRWSGVGLAQIYDWAYDACTPTQRQNLVAMADQAAPYYLTNQIAPNVGGYRAQGNVFIGQMLGVAALSIATHEPLSHDITARLEELRLAYEASTLKCIQGTNAVAPLESCWGGSWPEGVSYAAEAKMMVIDLLDMYRIATNYDPFPAVSDFLDQSMQFMFASGSPGGYANGGITMRHAVPYRDIVAQSDFPLDFVSSHRDLMVRLAWQFRRMGNHASARVQYWLNRFMPYYFPWARSMGETQVQEFLWSDLSASEQDFRPATPVDYATPFMFLSRSDWTDNASFVSFMAMPQGGDHMHADAGDFGLYRRGEWLTSEVAMYSTIGTAGAVHNTLYLNFHSSFHGRQGTVADWARFRKGADGSWAECLSAGNVCYARADLTGVYQFSGYQISPDSQGVYRDFLYLKPDTLVLGDRVQYVPGLETASTIYVQGRQRPVISGRSATLPRGTQQVRVDVAAPSDAVLTGRKLDRLYVMGARKLDDSRLDLYLDGRSDLPNGAQVQVGVNGLGATGVWSMLNRTWTIKMNNGSSGLFPYADGVGYDLERLRLESPGAFRNIPNNAQWDPSQVVATNLTRVYAGQSLSYDPETLFRLEVTGGAHRNSESFLTVVRGMDAGADAAPVWDASTAVMSAAQWGTTLVAIPKNLNVPTSLQYKLYNGGGSVSHYVMGLPPQTSFSVNANEGIVAITPGAGYTTSAHGLLRFVTTAGGVAPPPDVGQVPFTVPDLRALDGRTFRVNDEIGFTYTGSATGFEWEILASSEQQAAGSKPLSAAGAGATAFGTTSAPRFSLASENLTPGQYTLRVRALNGSQTSAWATANIALVLPDLNAVRVYPNPWRSDRHASRDIRFDNLSLGANVKIFNTAGQLVREVPVSGSTANWDRRNKSGDTVASGIYIFLIKDSSGSERKGKLAIVK